MAQSGGEKRGSSERTVPVAKNRLEYEHREIIWRFPSNPFDCNCDICGGHCVISNTHFRSDEPRSGMRGTTEGYWVRRNGKRRKVLLGKLGELRVCYATCAHKNHTVGGIVRFDIRSEVVPLD